MILSLLEFIELDREYKLYENYYANLKQFFSHDLLYSLNDISLETDYIFEALNSHKREDIQKAIIKHYGNDYNIIFNNWMKNDKTLDTLSFQLIIKDIYDFNLLKEKKFNDILNFYGYIMSYKTIINQNNKRFFNNPEFLGTYYTITPIWTNKANDLVYKKNKGVLYHFTLSKNKESILKKGLRIKNNRSISYPERIYCYSYFGNIRKNTYNKNVLAFIKHLYNLTILSLNNISVFRIDIPQDKELYKIDFYTDDNMVEDEAVFTYNNIPPEYISYIGEINFID